MCIHDALQLGLIAGIFWPIYLFSWKKKKANTVSKPTPGHRQTVTVHGLKTADF